MEETSVLLNNIRDEFNPAPRKAGKSKKGAKGKSKKGKSKKSSWARRIDR
jgi:hypothetical protein